MGIIHGDAGIGKIKGAEKFVRENPAASVYIRGSHHRPAGRRDLIAPLIILLIYLGGERCGGKSRIGFYDSSQIHMTITGGAVPALMQPPPGAGHQPGKYGVRLLQILEHDRGYATGIIDFYKDNVLDTGKFAAFELPSSRFSDIFL